MTSGASATSSAACLRMSPSIAAGPADIDLHVAAVGPAQLLQRLQERHQTVLFLGIVRRYVISTPMRRIRSACCARAASGHGRRAAEQRDELAPLHSITSSARASSVGGTSMPSALAVRRLIRNSNFVGPSTGIKLGFAPFSILST